MIRTARPGDDDALLTLWAECFPGVRRLPALHALDPGRYHRTFVAARADGTLDAVVVYVPRSVRDANGTPHRIGGIGSVATRPEARGRGLVRALLSAATDTMTDEGCAWSLLFTGTPGVYRGSGWTEFARPTTEGRLAAPHTVPSAPGETPTPHRVRAVTPADTPALARLQSAYNATRPLTAVRGPDDWRVRVPALYARPCWSLLAEDPADGTLTGWLVARPAAPGRTDVLETALHPGHPDALGALYTALADRVRAAGHTRVRVLLPPSPAVTEAEPRLLAPGTVTTGADTSGMARPLLAPRAAVTRTVTAPGAAHWYGDSF
ncbi:GNAT family N-acetyltransferase [Streptomyces uncialis]|uniref:N-acetyltransferase domain-containing protein n=1 Tax=Streptomyces uncialis TaxID=1048205 RepID=A0A1Q4V344_9ACTN|nr:GNAT family N-acetyltransferase [Streptomyces uncialis]OKH92234.1 hypothetical protein AB852_25240 [Streptomyces uncialis]